MDRKKTGSRVFGIVLCFLLASLASSQTNLLQDPGMENWSSANTLTQWTKESSITLTQESSFKHDGNYGAKLKRGSSNTGIYQEVSVASGSAYVFNTWLLYQADSVEVGILITWLDANRISLGWDGPVKATTIGVWQQVSLAATAPTGAVYARCLIRAYKSKGGLCYADDSKFYTDTPLSVCVHSFYAESDHDWIAVHWRTESEVGTLGFHMLRAECESGPFQGINTVLIPGQGNASTGKSYVFLDKNVEKGKIYWYRLEEAEENGGRKCIGTVGAMVKQNPLLPDVPELLTNYPNPFNPSTTIRFCVSQQEAESSVSLSIYNILGKRIKTLVQNLRKPGTHFAIWDGKTEEGRDVESGLYFCVLSSQEQFIGSVRMMKIK